MLLYYAMINIGRDQGIYKSEGDKEISLVLLHVENESTDGGTATADLRERDIAVDLLTEEKNPPVGTITMHPLGLAPFAGPFDFTTRLRRRQIFCFDVQRFQFIY